MTGNPELVFSHESAGSTYEFTSAVKAETGYAILPSGIIMKWGSDTVSAAASKVVTFSNGAGIPNYTTVYNIQVSREGAAGDTGILYVESSTTTTLTVYNTSESSKKFYYSVIGV